MEYIYAALLLHKLGQPVDETNLKKVVSATGAHVDEGKIKILVASLNGVDIDKELENAVALSASASSAAAPAAEHKKEEKKEEEKMSAAAEGLSSLFG
ncbi:MAG TPA: 50S ribosomal protein L12 [Candidatus Paceibacterota bacterium]|nr:50S ribosomal protein L12 [Candidatus Paceibacterota bacterium]